LAPSATKSTHASTTKLSGVCIPGKENSVHHMTPSDTTISENEEPGPQATDSASQSPTLVRRPVVTVTNEEFTKIFKDMEDAESARDSHW
jgi:hypothetical protein